MDSDSSEPGDDGRTAAALHHLPRRLLRSRAVLTVRGGDNDDEEEIVEPKTSRTAWEKCDPAFNQPEWNPADAARSEEFEQSIQDDPIISSFMAFFSIDLIELILKESKRYARAKNEELDLSKEELLVVVGIMLFSGYHKLPRTRNYWEDAPDIGIDLVKEAMR